MPDERTPLVGGSASAASTTGGAYSTPAVAQPPAVGPDTPLQERAAQLLASGGGDNSNLANIDLTHELASALYALHVVERHDRARGSARAAASRASATARQRAALRDHALAVLDEALHGEQPDENKDDEEDVLDLNFGLIIEPGNWTTGGSMMGEGGREEVTNRPFLPSRCTPLPPHHPRCRARAPAHPRRAPPRMVAPTPHDGARPPRHPPERRHACVSQNPPAQRARVAPLLTSALCLTCNARCARLEHCHIDGRHHWHTIDARMHANDAMDAMHPSSSADRPWLRPTTAAHTCSSSSHRLCSSPSPSSRRWSPTSMCGPTRRDRPPSSGRCGRGPRSLP